MELRKRLEIALFLGRVMVKKMSPTELQVKYRKKYLFFRDTYARTRTNNARSATSLGYFQPNNLALRARLQV